MKSNKKLWKWNNQDGFTLIEMVLTLFVLSLIIFSMQTLMGHFQTNYQRIKKDRTTEWHQFITGLEQEIADYETISTDGQILYLGQGNKQAEIVLRGHKIFKRPGHQPLIYGISAWEVTVDQSIIYIALLTEEGDYYKGSIIHED